MTAKNATYQLLDISVIFRCHSCRQQLFVNETDFTWDKQQIWNVGRFHEIQCPKCSALNKFPAKLINALLG